MKWKWKWFSYVDQINRSIKTYGRDGGGGEMTRFSEIFGRWEKNLEECNRPVLIRRFGSD